MKIQDIQDELRSKQSVVKQAKEELGKATDKFNQTYADANRKGKKLGEEFIFSLADKLVEKIKVNNRSLKFLEKMKGSKMNYSLIELFVDDDGNKVSIHNHMWTENIDEGITYFVREYRGTKRIDNNYTIRPENSVDEAVEQILNHLPVSFKK